MDTLDKIVHLLSTQNKTQKDLTDFLKLQKGVFTQWKSGTSQSYKKHIQKIAEFLGTTSAYLLGETNNPNPTRRQRNQRQRHQIRPFRRRK